LLAYLTEQTNVRDIRLFVTDDSYFDYHVPENLRSYISDHISDIRR
jgi:hypothetical protein